MGERTNRLTRIELMQNKWKMSAMIWTNYEQNEKRSQKSRLDILRRKCHIEELAEAQKLEYLY